MARFDICGVSHQLIRASPTELHLQAAKRVLRYLKGIMDLRFFYQKKRNKEVMTYTDSDYVGDMDDRKNTSGYVFYLVKELCHGLPKNNWLLRCLLLKQNL